jgi:hypothetical protein
MSPVGLGTKNYCAGEGQQQFSSPSVRQLERDNWRGPAANLLNWTGAVQVTKTNVRPDLSSEGAPDVDKTVIVKQKLISGHESQMGLDTKTDWPTDRLS